MNDSAPLDDSEPNESSDAGDPRNRHAPAARPGAPAPDSPPDPAAPRSLRRTVRVTAIGALAATLISVVFIASFIGALHAPGPRSVPVGVVGNTAQASALSSALSQQRPGGYTVTRYPTVAAAQSAILDRTVDAALTQAPRGALLQVASAVSPAATNATVKDIGAVVQAGGVRLAVQDIRPLPPNDPEGISQVFFAVALIAPSLIFANLLVTKFGRTLHPIGQVIAIIVYAVVVSAVATIIADPVIGALTGAPWGLFGIGTLLAFAVTAAASAAARWTGGLGYALLFLLFIPVGIASSGTTLGPQMITPWYADLGKALPAGSALPAVQNTVYFNGNAITGPLLVLSAWALAGAIALLLVAVFHPPAPGQPTPNPEQDTATPRESGAQG